MLEKSICVPTYLNGASKLVILTLIVLNTVEHTRRISPVGGLKRGVDEITVRHIPTIRRVAISAIIVSS